jgi:O-antigen/teichoic acid export membrane protein
VTSQTKAPPDHTDATAIAELSAGSVPGRSFGRGLGFLIQVVLARLLGAEAFGLYSVGWTLLRVVSLLAHLGTDAGVVRFGSASWPQDRDRVQRVVRLGVAAGGLSSLLIGVAFVVSADWVAASIFNKPLLGPVLRAFGFAVPVTAMLRILAAATTVTRRMHYMVLVEELAQPLLQLGIFVALVLLNVPALTAALAAVVCSFFLASGWASTFVWRLLGGSLGDGAGPGPRLSGILSFSIPVAAGGFLGSFTLMADRLLIGALGTEAEAGVYAVASLVSIVFATILSGFKSSFSPLAASLSAAGDFERLQHAFRLTTRWCLLLSVPVFLFLASSGEDLLRLGLGAGFQAGYIPMLVLSVAQLVNAGTGPVDTLLIMSGRQNHWIAIAGVGLAVLFILGAAWIPTWGLLGASVASAVSVILISLGGLWMAHRTLRVFPYDRRTLAVLLAGFVTGATLVGIGRIGLPAVGLRLLLNGLTSAGLFSALVVIGGLLPEERHALQAVERRFRAGAAKLLSRS